MILTLKQAAEYLGCGEKHVRWLLTTKQVNGGKVANQWRTTTEALDAFVLAGGEPLTKFAIERRERRKGGRPKKEVCA